MNNWAPLILLSALTGSIADVITKYVFKNNPKISVSYWMVISWIPEIILLSVLILATGRIKDLIAVPVFVLVPIIIVSAVKFIGNKASYTAMKFIPISVVYILGLSSTVFTNILGVIIYHESVTPIKIVGIALVILSIIILFYERHHLKHLFDKYALFVIISAMFYSIGWLLDKYFGLNVDFFIFRFLYSIVNMIIFFMIDINEMAEGHKAFNEKPKKLIIPLIVVSFLYFAYSFAYMAAYKNGAEAGKVDAINNIGVFVVIALEAFILKDKTNLLKKIVSAIICVIGVSLLV
jgi:drug/metabolite transporter (DMT)-like permease